MKNTADHQDDHDDDGKLDKRPLLPDSSFSTTTGASAGGGGLAGESRQKFTVYLAYSVFTAVLGSFLFGWNIGGASGSLDGWDPIDISPLRYSLYSDIPIFLLF